MPHHPPGRPRGRAHRAGRRRLWAVATVAALAALGAGLVTVGPGLVEEHERRAEYLPVVRKDVEYATTSAAGHTVYLPPEWTRDLSHYPEYATFLPEGGLFSSGHLGGLWMLVSQFDADALRGRDAATTPEALCDPTGPGGAEGRSPHATGKAAKTYRYYCYAVPGHDARLKIRVWKAAADLDPDLELELAVPEDGRIMNVSASDADVPVDDPVAWAAHFIDDLAEFDPAAYSAEEVYEAHRDAGHYEDY